MVPEAKVEGGVPQTQGWFVVNAEESRWLYNELGWYAGFEGRDEAAFDELGLNLNVLHPGMPMAMYHEEPGQEAFLVLRGECLLIVEGEERPLKTWDFFHCPPLTKHVILGAGDAPALGARSRRPQGTGDLSRGSNRGPSRCGCRAGSRVARRSLRGVLEAQRGAAAGALVRDQGQRLDDRAAI